MRDDLLRRFAEAEGLSWAEVQGVVDYAKDAKADLFEHEPVKVKDFIEWPGFMDAKGRLYPEVLAGVIGANDGTRYESVWTGGIGSGKTTAALYTQAYQVYLLLTMTDPHAYFGLDPTSEIVLIFQSLNAKKAKELDFERFRNMIKASPIFNSLEGYIPDDSMTTVLKFPKNIQVKYVHGGSDAAIGENVIGGIIDEINFQAVIEKSKKNQDGGVYNQAVENYTAIARRRESRFLKQGWLPGQLCLVSSRRYRGQFTDKKEEEARTNKGIFIYDKRVWDVKPWDYSGETFRVYAGSLTTRPRLLADGEENPGDGEVVDVPVELRNSFEKGDLLDALRDHAGVSTTAIHPFIARPDLVAKCFGKRASIFSRPECDFETMKAKAFVEQFESPKVPRFVHIDLAKSGDSCGLAIGWVREFVQVVRIEGDNPDVETLPSVVIDGVLEIRPPPGGEIEFEKVRRLLYRLRQLGLNLKWVTYDSWQSTDSLQILKRKGFSVGEASLDRDTKGYDVTKQALYDGRVELPEHQKCLEEFAQLEKNAEKGKVDHRADGSKDCSDAVAGVVWGLSRRRAVWIEHGVALNHVPDDLRLTAAKEAEQEAQDEEATTGRNAPGRFRTGKLGSPVR